MMSENIIKNNLTEDFKNATFLAGYSKSNKTGKSSSFCIGRTTDPEMAFAIFSLRELADKLEEKLKKRNKFVFEFNGKSPTEE